MHSADSIYDVDDHSSLDVNLALGFVDDNFIYILPRI